MSALAKQLRRSESLGRFALAASALGSESEVVFSALDMLATLIPLTGAAAVLHAEGGLEVILARSRQGETFVTEPDSDELPRALEPALAVEVVAGTPTHPLLRWLDQAHPGLASDARRSTITFKLSSGALAASDVLVIRSETLSPGEQSASQEDLGFLEQLAAHINAALRIVRARFDLERRVEQRTSELGDANAELATRLSELHRSQAQLVDVSRKAGMADVATSVLHNIGNVLNSVNVSAGVVAAVAQSSTASVLEKTVALLASQPDPVRFLAEDPRGPRVLDCFAAISQTLNRERAATLEELKVLEKNIDHIKVIVRSQQSLAGGGGLIEQLMLSDLIEDALKMNAASYENHQVTIRREFAALRAVTTDRHKVLQILINLLSNAKQAVASRRADRRVTLRTREVDENLVAIEVDDNGIGIPAGNLEKVFNLGFTTKAEGHGFGLHASACGALELGGRLTVHSDGPACGARFTLVIPRTPLAQRVGAPKDSGWSGAEARP